MPRLRRRDSAAFSTLYGMMADRLASFAFRLVGDRGAAEDAVQQAFLELVPAIAELRGEGRSLRAWLYRSVRFTCLDELRRRSRRPEDPSGDLPEVPVEPDLEGVAMDAELEAALSRLTERQRTVLLLRHVQGLDGADVAAVLETNRAAVYAVAARAEAALRKMLSSVESGASPASEPEKKPLRGERPHEE